MISLVYLSLVFCFLSVEGAPVNEDREKSLLHVTPRIQVFLREGDTPLEEIDADLAAAFNNYAVKHNKIIVGVPISQKIRENEVDSDIPAIPKK